MDRQDLWHQVAAAASRLLHVLRGETRRRGRRETPGRAFAVRRQQPQAVRLRLHPDRRRMAGGNPRQRTDQELHHARPPRRVSRRHEGHGRRRSAGPGLTPGIWFMPFAGNYKDPYFKDHQDWFAKGPDGKPYETDVGRHLPRHDLSRRPRASAGHRPSHRPRRGYRLFKLDGFWTGSATRLTYVNDGYVDDHIGEAGFSDPDVTNIEALRRGAKLVRQAAGPDVFLLGCCVSQNMRSFGGTFGLLDAMRVGTRQRRGPTSARRTPRGSGSSTAGCGGTIRIASPSAWACRWSRRGSTLPSSPLPAISFTTAIGCPIFRPSGWTSCGGVFPRTTWPRVRWTCFESPVARIWHLADTRQSRRRDVVALYNWDQNPTRISETAERIGLPPAKEYVGFDFWADKFLPPFAGEGRGRSAGRRLLPDPRHPAAYGPSAVAEHLAPCDPGHGGRERGAHGCGRNRRLRPRARWSPAIPTSFASWSPQARSPGGPRPRAFPRTIEKAGVEVSFRQDGPRLRATIASPVSRQVKWRVQFAPGSVAGWGPAP